MSERIQMTLFVAFWLLLPACATPSQGFSAATLAFSQGDLALKDGSLKVAAALHRTGIKATRKLVADFPKAPLVKGIVAGDIKVGAYSYQTIVKDLAPRSELWLKHDKSILARAFLEAQAVSLREERVEVLTNIATAMAEAGQSEAAAVVIAAVREELAALVDPSEIAWGSLNLAVALTATGDLEAALTEVWAVLDTLEDDPFVPPMLVGDLLTELLDWCATIDDREVVLPMLERVGEIAALVGPENDAEFVLEMVAFEMAQRGDCMAAQFMSESLLSMNIEDMCDCGDEEVESGEERARLELLFDIFDECSEADPDSAIILLEDAILEAEELGWYEFMSDISWGFASLGQYDQALEAARSISEPLPRIDAFLAIVEELPEDEREGGPVELELLHEAAAIDLSSCDAAARPRYRARLSVALGRAGDLPRAEEQARTALVLAEKLPTERRGRVALELVLLSPRLTDKEKRRLVKMALKDSKSHSLLPARLQALRSAFDAWLAVGDTKRAQEFLTRAVAIAEAAEELEDESFWCDAAVGYVATGAYVETLEVLDRLSAEAQHWCLVRLTSSTEHKELNQELRKRIDDALARRAEPAAVAAGTSAEVITQPVVLPCDKALGEGMKATVSGADRVRYLLDLAPRCEGQSAP